MARWRVPNWLNDALRSRRGVACVSPAMKMSARVGVGAQFHAESVHDQALVEQHETVHARQGSNETHATQRFRLVFVQPVLAGHGIHMRFDRQHVAGHATVLSDDLRRVALEQLVFGKPDDSLRQAVVGQVVLHVQIGRQIAGDDQQPAAVADIAGYTPGSGRSRSASAPAIRLRPAPDRARRSRPIGIDASSASVACRFTFKHIVHRSGPHHVVVFLDQVVLFQAAQQREVLVDAQISHAHDRGLEHPGRRGVEMESSAT